MAGSSGTKRKKKAGSVILLILIVTGVAALLVWQLVIVPKQKLQQATQLMAQGDYDAAYEIMNGIRRYDLVEQSMYDRALEALSRGEDLDWAYAMLYEIGREDVAENDRCDRAFAALDGKDYVMAEEILSQIPSAEPLREKIYEQAAQYLQAGDTRSAVCLLQRLPADDPQAKEKLAEIAADSLKEAEPGNTVYFGSYEQDNVTEDGKEPIEWVVLAKDGNRIMLLSGKVLLYKQFQENDMPVNCDSCTLRAWLTGEFYNEAFSSEEQQRIPAVTVRAEANPLLAQRSVRLKAGDDTEDKVFLLGYAEAGTYVETVDFRDFGTTVYADATNPGVISVGWWLRTSGDALTKHTNADRTFGTDRVLNDCDFGIDNELWSGVRPAIWIITDGAE